MMEEEDDGNDVTTILREIVDEAGIASNLYTSGVALEMSVVSV